MGDIAKHTRSTAAMSPRYITTNKVLHEISRAVEGALMETHHTHSAQEIPDFDTEAWKVRLLAEEDYKYVLLVSYTIKHHVNSSCFSL